MKQHVVKKILCVCMAATLCMGSLMGCGIGNTEVVWTSHLNGSTVFKIGDESCKLSDAKVFLINYRNIYGKTFGIKAWKQSYNGQTMEEYVKQTTVSQLAKMKTMVLLAKEKNFKLSEKEEEAVVEAAKKYYDSLTWEDKEYLGATKSSVEDLYREMALATKLYTNLTGGINEEVSDDDARVMQVEQIVLTDEDKAKSVEKKIEAGNDFSNLASIYNTASNTKVTLYKQKMGENTRKALTSLDDGEVSKCIEEDGKYYFYKVITKIDRQLTEENKEVIVKERATKAFDEVYSNFKAKLSSTYNHDMWDEFSIEEDNKATTSNFFEVFDETLDL